MKTSALKKHELPPALPGFSAIARVWDEKNQRVAAKIQSGEFYVSKQGELINTVLGSCISVCIRDVKNSIGGMNHFMLPMDSNQAESKKLLSASARYGNWAMEFLINEILKAGGRKEYFEIKVFGGGQVLADMEFMDIGQRNINFVLSYLRDEKLTIKSQDVGGVYPRKLQYFTDTGVVRLKKIVNHANESSLQSTERTYARSLKNQSSNAGDITLFD